MKEERQDADHLLTIVLKELKQAARSSQDFSPAVHAGFEKPT